MLFKAPYLTIETPFFINFKFPLYFCKMIKTTLNPTTSLMEEHFTTLKYHNHQHYNNIMYYWIFFYHFLFMTNWKFWCGRLFIVVISLYVQSFIKNFPLKLIFIKFFLTLQCLWHVVTNKMYSNWQLNCWCVH